jgi:hypothetical protein
MNDDLNTLLSAPLPDIPDNGFSRRVMVRIERVRRRDAAVSVAAIGLAALAAVPFLPLEGIFKSLVPATIILMHQPGLYLAAAAIALSLMAEKELFRS